MSNDQSPLSNAAATLWHLALTVLGPMILLAGLLYVLLVGLFLVLARRAYVPGLMSFCACFAGILFPYTIMSFICLFLHGGCLGDWPGLALFPTRYFVVPFSAPLTASAWIFCIVKYNFKIAETEIYFSAFVLVLNGLNYFNVMQVLDRMQ